MLVTENIFSSLFQVLGSRPSATIQMWVGSKPLKTLSTQVVLFLFHLDLEGTSLLSCVAKIDLIFMFRL